MTPEEANTNANRALQLVRSRQFEEARAIELLPSDRALVEKRITAARDAEVAR